VEAVELSAEGFPTTDTLLPTRIVARFAGNPNAARLALVKGMELRQALSCVLEPSAF
jgi:hypothetical protein